VGSLNPWPAARNDTQALICSIRRLVRKRECKFSLLFAIYCIRCVADVVCGRTNDVKTGVLNNLRRFGFVDFGPPLLGWRRDVCKGVIGFGVDETYVIQEVVWMAAVFV
jgi:hypothetical protein